MPMPLLPAERMGEPRIRGQWKIRAASLCAVLAVATSTGLAGLSACGGGGSGSGGANQPSAQISASLVTDVVGLLFGWFSTDTTGALRAETPSGALLARLRPLILAARAGDGGGMAGVDNSTKDCTQAGTATTDRVWDGPDNAQVCNDVENLRFSRTFDGCAVAGVTADGTEAATYRGDQCCPRELDYHTEGLSVSTSDSDLLINANVQGSTFECTTTGNTAEWVATGLRFDLRVAGTRGPAAVDTTYRDIDLNVTQYTLLAGDLIHVAFDLTGKVEGLCSDGFVDVITTVPIELNLNQACPVNGQTIVSSGGDSVTTSYNIDGSVDVISFIDHNYEEVHYASCTDIGFCS